MLLGMALFWTCAALLAGVAFAGLLKRRFAAIVFAALAGYAALAAADGKDLCEQFGIDVYLYSALVYAAGSIVLSLSVSLVDALLPADLPPPEWEVIDYRRHAHLCLLLGTAALGLMGISRPDLLATWSEARPDEGPLAVFATFLFLLACPGIVSAFRARLLNVGIVLGFICVATFVLSGSRAAVLGALMLALWLLLVRARTTGARVRTLALVGLAGFTLHVLLRQLRGLGVAGLLAAFADGNLTDALLGSESEADLSGGEAAIPKYLMFATASSSVHDFGFMTSMLRLVLFAVPRIDGWIDKPVDVTYLLWEKAFVAGLFADAEGQQLLLDSYISGTLGSLHATAFGEFFLAGGWLSLVLSSALLGVVLVLIDYLMRRADRLTSLALCGPVLIGFLFVARGNSVIGLGYFLYLGVILLALRYARLALLPRASATQ